MLDPNKYSKHRDERGSGMIAVFVLVITCVAIAASVLLPAMSRHREAQAHLQGQRAFYLAEAGVDWAISELRSTNGVIPGNTTETQSPQGQGSFTLTYTSGDANGIDDDGDNVTDESDEDEYTTLLSVGTSGDESRAVSVLMRTAITAPEFTSSILINVDAPVFESNSNSIYVDGREHDIDGVLDPTGVVRPAIGSPAPVQDLIDQISRPHLFVGSGGTPSAEQLPAIDLQALVEQTKAAATMVVQSGTHSGVDWGTATMAGVELVYCDGDLHLSGNGSGAGYLVVDGDLIISGGFTWHGVVLVRGKSRMTGGGSGKRIIGAMVVGEEIEAVGGGGATTQTVQLRGTVDLLFSSEAIRIASARVSIVSIQGWYEVPVP